MFERYTSKGRRAIFFARYESSQLGSPSIESEHLLLGLFDENKALYQIFPDRQPAIDSIKAEIAQHSRPGPKLSTSIDLPLSDECKRILAYAHEEADQLSHKFIGTEHLFLGVLRQPASFAARLLDAKGVSLEAARRHIRNKPAEEVGPAPKSRGIPSGYRSNKLLFNALAQILILELRRIGGPRVPTRLFYRHISQDAYEPIGNPGDELSYESPVTCSGQAVVLFNSVKWDKGGHGGDWDGIYRFHLDTKALEICVSKEKLRLSEPHGRMWVVELVALSEDASTLFVNIGIEKTVTGGGVVNYFFAKIGVEDQQVELLSPLRDIRY